MNELLLSMKSRVESITLLNSMVQESSNTKVVYDLLRTHKQNEKIRIEKENFILSILKIHKNLNFEQQVYTFINEKCFCENSGNHEMFRR